MSKEIKFNPVDELSEITVPRPAPAKDYMPEWLEKAMPFFTKKPEFDVQTGKPNPTVKMCMPFTDSFEMGYIQETWTDIYIQKREDGTYFYYPAGPKIMSERPLEASSLMPVDKNYLEQHFTWHPPWMPELPAGYSCILTHPLNRNDLPFYTFTGIIDADKFIMSEKQSNIPFLLDKDFTGLIKKGTPMYQIIPFKRDDWTSSSTKFDANRQLSFTQKIRQHVWNGYKKICWTKKRFT